MNKSHTVQAKCNKIFSEKTHFNSHVWILKIQIKIYQFDIQLVSGSTQSLFPKRILQHLLELYNFISYVNRGKYLNSTLIPGSLKKTEKS